VLGDLPPDKLKLAKEEFRKMEEMGIVRRSLSNWSSTLHMVPKAGGSWRPCGDYRRLNDETTPGKYPIPLIQDYSANLMKVRIFSKINLVRGYHQIPISEADIRKTAVITPFGLYEFLRMPFGLKNSAQAWTASVKGQGLNFVFVYLDDILVSSSSGEEHKQHLRQLFKCLSQNGLIVNDVCL
jgi:cleavage and polyadenylation specificity factor subunit 1